MAIYKKVRLRDPITGDYLIPVTDNSDTGDIDAKTLEGHPASYFCTADQYQELFQSVSDGKTSIADAITDKGGTASATSTFAELAQAISAFNIGTDTSTGTATADQILAGQIAFSKGVKLTGTMVNRGAVSQSISPGGSYTIPAGYHNGSGKVTASAGRTVSTSSWTFQGVDSDRGYILRMPISNPSIAFVYFNNYSGADRWHHKFLKINGSWVDISGYSYSTSTTVYNSGYLFYSKEMTSVNADSGEYPYTCYYALCVS